MSFHVVRSAEARWQGTLPEGSGRIALGSADDVETQSALLSLARDCMGSPRYVVPQARERA